MFQLEIKLMPCSEKREFLKMKQYQEKKVQKGKNIVTTLGHN